MRCLLGLPWCCAVWGSWLHHISSNSVAELQELCGSQQVQPEALRGWRGEELLQRLFLVVEGLLQSELGVFWHKESP